MSPEDEEAIDQRKTGHIDRPLGIRLRLERDARRLTQEELAEKLDVSPATIQKYEQGRVRIPASRLWQICGLFNLDVADVFGELPHHIIPPAGPGVREPDTRFFGITEDSTNDQTKAKQVSAVARAAAKLPEDRLAIAVDLIKALKPKC